MEFVVFCVVFIITCGECTKDPSSSVQVFDRDLRKNGQLMEIPDTSNKPKGDYTYEVKQDLEVFLQRWRNESKQDHEELQNLLEKRTYNVYENAVAIQILFIINIILMKVGGQVISNGLSKYIFPQKPVSVKTAFCNQSSGRCKEAQQGGSDNICKTKDNYVETCLSDESDQSTVNVGDNNISPEEKTDKTLVNGYCNSVGDSFEINTGKIEDHTKARGTVTKDSSLKDEPCNLTRIRGTEHKLTCIPEVIDEPEETEVTSDNPPKHDKEDSWQSDATSVKSTVPFRLDDMEIQCDAHDMDVDQMEEMLYQTSNFTRNSSNNINSSLVMTNATVYVGQNEPGVERDLHTGESKSQLWYQGTMWNRGVDVKIVNDKNCYVGTVYKYTRLYPYMNNKADDKNVMPGEIWRVDSIEDNVRCITVGNGTNVPKKTDIQTSDVFACEHNAERTGSVDDIEEDGGALVGEDEIDGLMASASVHHHSSSSFKNGGEKNVSTSSNDIASDSDVSRVPSGMATKEVHKGISSEMQAILSCIDLRVDDMPGPITNTRDNQNNAYYWPYQNESFEDIPQIESNNRLIYAELRRIDEVLGYFSSGDSIEVFVNLRVTDVDAMLERLCEITGEEPGKFHIKDCDEQWHD